SPSPTPSRSSIQIIGHTDKQGEDKKGSAYNDNLSIRRARSVVGLLVQKYPALQGRLKAEGKGSREPRYQGEGEEIYRLNRRIEVVLPQ
ncbi:MAG: OmpA family protein, partial [Pseudomonadota bacterium]